MLRNSSAISETTVEHRTHEKSKTQVALLPYDIQEVCFALCREGWGGRGWVRISWIFTISSITTGVIDLIVACM